MSPNEWETNRVDRTICVKENGYVPSVVHQFDRLLNTTHFFKKNRTSDMILKPTVRSICEAHILEDI